ncbi:hypothetical protein BJ138DRAFT_1129568 [Hygrophoropsis aurantiaca]|uniref:Uncharacterized protein n=1 Tax=Hygrophoropsis aurantiaca TaxID=72124 RepID=A0ACB8A2H2_9AGAM|nr:hypothetical protein BJ138DRAFT_1129568 [Hygrophoropsis aurantiaca]
MSTRKNNILNFSTVLFSTNNATLAQFWATTSAVVGEIEQASVMMISPEHAGNAPWLLIKSASVIFIRSLNRTPAERAMNSSPLFFNHKDNTVTLSLGDPIYRISFDHAGCYWAFHMLSGSSHFDQFRSRDLNTNTLFNAWVAFRIPAETPEGMTGPVGTCHISSARALPLPAQFPCPDEINITMEVPTAYLFAHVGREAGDDAPTASSSSAGRNSPDVNAYSTSSDAPIDATALAGSSSAGRNSPGVIIYPATPDALVDAAALPGGSSVVSHGAGTNANTNSTVISPHYNSDGTLVAYPNHTPTHGPVDHAVYAIDNQPRETAPAMIARYLDINPKSLYDNFPSTYMPNILSVDPADADEPPYIVAPDPTYWRPTTTRRTSSLRSTLERRPSSARAKIAYNFANISNKVSESSSMQLTATDFAMQVSNRPAKRLRRD